jgi:hypothetical protein
VEAMKPLTTLNRETQTLKEKQKATKINDYEQEIDIYTNASTADTKF